ncbi:hypothetical protein B0J12DRAFT_45634 [Macrophomina phaseolina]|uniref:Cupredoxin n=1 Tax=Macrophomina phaseolina TaxID=35725 RepID=A0ABQ8GGP9_9PEZI|nr:hypothetical protein B0J12DRAFT_45634 [Macrophomina phaseolina]
MSTTPRSLLAGLLLPLISHNVNALTNANFFYYPSLSEPVPQVIAGDTVNVSWSSNYPKGTLMVHCNGTQVSTTNGLDSAATEPVTIRDGWASPCHFQLGITDGVGWFDSGYLEIVDGDRETTTWAATGSCMTTTSAAATASATATSSSATSSSSATRIADAASSTTSAACDPTKNSGPGMGAGIGIGIGISAGCAAIPLLFLLLRRKKQVVDEKPAPAQNQGWGEYYNRAGGLTGSAEADGRAYQELSGQGNLIELDGQGRK